MASPLVKSTLERISTHNPSAKDRDRQLTSLVLMENVMES